MTRLTAGKNRLARFFTADNVVDRRNISSQVIVWFKEALLSTYEWKE
jgi:hypothetical protein